MQKMVLTPQMRHSIKLLGMSTKDINDYIDSAVEENPFLEKKYEHKEDFRGPDFSRNFDRESYFARSYENNAHQEDPRQGLLSQLRMLNLNEKSIEIAEHLISDIDDNGYIKSGSEEIADRLMVPAEDVEETVTLIQNLEPAGIGARDIGECLNIQLRRRGKGEESLECKIVCHHLADVARNDTEKISKSLGAGEAEVKEALKIIKGLNPKPASTMMGKRAEPVIPDFIARVKKRSVMLEPNKRWLPALNLYNPYRENEEVSGDKEAEKFVKENLKSAKGLIDGLKRREDTMYNVTDYIIKFHREEIGRDVNNIKSLTIKKVAEALDMHPSTINRAVSNKYIDINSNVVPLKKLLSHAVKKENGESTSKASVKNAIRELVNNEDKTKPLSDSAVCRALSDRGILIKRRTVAKYRDSLKILPTHLRRKK